MTTEEAIIELMNDYRNSPEVAEAAYLVVEGFNSDQIVRNLDIRYGTGQGYARFKEDLEGMTGFEVDDNSGFELVIDDRGRSLDYVDAKDVGAPLSGRIRNAFLAEVEPELREQMQSNISGLSEDEKLIAGITRNGYDMNLWGSDSRDQTVWDIHTLITNQTLSDREKTSFVQGLVEAGCFYFQYTNSILLSPMLVNLEDPFDQLPQVEKLPPESG